MAIHHAESWDRGWSKGEEERAGEKEENFVTCSHSRAELVAELVAGK